MVASWVLPTKYVSTVPFTTIASVSGPDESQAHATVDFPVHITMVRTTGNLVCHHHSPVLAIGRSICSVAVPLPVTVTCTLTL